MNIILKKELGIAVKKFENTEVSNNKNLQYYYDHIDEPNDDFHLISLKRDKYSTYVINGKTMMKWKYMNKM